MATSVRSTSVLLLIALAAVLASPLAARTRSVTDAQAPRALESGGPVQVKWEDPAGFSEIRYSRNRWEAQRGDWVKQLAEHLQARAGKTLSPGERLEVVITDIERAGEYELVGSAMRDVRVVRDLYPPRMRLSFVRRGADGQIFDQGERSLSDLGFLSHAPGTTHDPLRFEKRMIDEWVRREFGRAQEIVGQR